MDSNGGSFVGDAGFENNQFDFNFPTNANSNQEK
jgi:hypothetical protein